MVFLFIVYLFSFSCIPLKDKKIMKEGINKAAPLLIMPHKIAACTQISNEPTINATNRHDHVPGVKIMVSHLLVCLTHFRSNKARR